MGVPVFAQSNGGDSTWRATGDRNGERRLLVHMLMICGAAIAVGVALSIVTGSVPTSTIALGNASEAKIVEIRDSRGAIVLSGEFRSRVDMLGKTHKEAALRDRSGQPVTGEIEIEISPPRQNRRSELEVDVVELAPRATFSVVVDDSVVGTFITDDRGAFDMELDEGASTPIVSVIG